MKKSFVFLLVIIVICLFIGRKILLNRIQLEQKKENMKNNIAQDTTKEDELFSAYYEKANKKMQNLTLEEKIAQLFIVGTFENSDLEELKEYQFGGYLLFKNFFSNKTEKQVKEVINQFQEDSKIPLLIAVDEEGGKVVRVSSNPALAKESFKSASEIYINGGLEAVKKDTIEKSKLLENLGINLNFAPVVDITRDPNDYMYERSLQQGKDLTAMYAKTVIQASKEYKVSYTLKHFPGYGNNTDTHKENSVDERTYEDIYENDLEPFRIGIKEKAEIIMISHNTVTSIDPKQPASISPAVHMLLREELGFSGIIITDDMIMGAIQEQYSLEEGIVKAILAGNDMMIVSIDKNTMDKVTKQKVGYQNIIECVKSAVENGIIEEKAIDQSVKRIVAWKYYKGLMDE